MKFRHRVLALLAALSVITYLDRVCISVAGPRIQNELHLSPQDWGLVTGAFAIAYALFEIPSEYLVRAPLIRQWDNRAQPGVIEPVLSGNSIEVDYAASR